MYSSPLIARPAAYAQAQNLTDGTFAVTQREGPFRSLKVMTQIPLAFVCAMPLTWGAVRWCPAGAHMADALSAGTMRNGPRASIPAWPKCGKGPTDSAVPSGGVRLA